MNLHCRPETIWLYIYQISPIAKQQPKKNKNKLQSQQNFKINKIDSNNMI